MMKFNWINKGMNKVLNKESAPAYRLTPEWELYTSVVTTSLNNSFYEQAEERIERVRTLIGKCDPLFVAQLAAYARETMNLRSIPLVMAVELARIHQGDNLVKRVTARTVRRADEITELLACYQQANRRTGTKKLNRLSKQLQAGLQDAFNTFDAYQFAKYNRSAEVCLKDALFLVHPKAKDERHVGLDYVSLGEQTGKMAAKVLKGEKKASEMNFEVIEEAAFYGNNKVAENLGITIPAELSDNAAALFDEITTN